MPALENYLGELMNELTMITSQPLCLKAQRIMPTNQEWYNHMQSERIYAKLQRVTEIEFLYYVYTCVQP